MKGGKNPPLILYTYSMALPDIILVFIFAIRHFYFL